MKKKQGQRQGKRAFVVDIIMAHGGYISAKDAWTELVDKRATTIRTVTEFGTTASSAVNDGKLSKKRGEDSEGKSRVLYGPPGIKVADGTTVYADGRTSVNEPTVVEAVWPVNPAVADIPLGRLLEYLGTDMDDVMSVIRDAVYDRPLTKLRTEYPGLEEIVKRVAGVE